MADGNESEVFKCNGDEIPSKWSEYYYEIYDLLIYNRRCIGTLIKTKREEFTTEFFNELMELYNEYCVILDEVIQNLDILITELSNNPTGSNCFDKTLFTNYILSYNTLEDKLQEINLLITTGGDVIGYDFNVGVDTTIVYPVSGSTSTKVTKCTGVYMKQMDFGSEFIGSVNIMEGAEEPKVTVEVAVQKERDGSWFKR